MPALRNQSCARSTAWPSPIAGSHGDKLRRSVLDLPVRTGDNTLMVLLPDVRLTAPCFGCLSPCPSGHGDGSGIIRAPPHQTGVRPERDRDGGEIRRDTHPQKWCEVSPRGSLLLTVSRQTSGQEDSVVRTDGDVANASPFGLHDDHGTPANHAGSVDRCPPLADGHQRDSSELGAAPRVLLVGGQPPRRWPPPFPTVSKPYPRRPREPKQWSCNV